MTTSITSYSSLASPLCVSASDAAAAAKDLATGAASAAKQRLLSALSSADLNGASSKERLLSLVQSTVERTRWRRSRLPGGPPLLRVLDDDDGTSWAMLHVLRHLDFPSLARFALTNSDAAGAVRCALLEPELKTFGLSTWHPGCGYGCALAAATLRLQPNEVLDFAQSLALELSGAAAEGAPPAVVAWRDSLVKSPAPTVLASLVKSSLFRADFDETDLIAVFDTFFCPPFAYVPFEDATEDDAPQIAADFCDFVRGAGVTRGAFGFSVVDMLVATMVNWEMEPEVKAAFLTTCLFEAAQPAGEDTAGGGTDGGDGDAQWWAAKDTPPSRPDSVLVEEARAIAASDDLTDDVRSALTTALDALERAWAATEEEAAEGEKAAEAAADASP